jgi:MutL-like protein
MLDEPSAILVAEIGSSTTRVTLVDAVAGEARLIGQAEVASTTEPPYENALIGVLEAASQIGESTGRQLLDEDGSLLMPQTSERDGVSSVIALTSAAGLMGVVITAVAGEVSARSALRACRATYTSVLQVVTLDDAARAAGRHDTSWIERQVQSLIGLRPDVVLMAGGLDGGVEDALVRLSHIVGLTAQNVWIDSDGQQRHDIAARPVIFAGNSNARDRVIEALSGRAELTIVDNVRPTLEVERLDPARRALTRRYADYILPNLPGMSALRRIAPVYTACDAAGLVTRFVAEQDGRAVLALDAGSASTAAYLQSQGRFSPAVLGDVGTGYGLGAVLADRGLAAIARWLPFPIGERDLTHWLLNKMLRPQLLPTTREEVLIEHAVAREALTLAIQALWDERPGASYDFVLAGGGVLAHAPHFGLAALTILDALQPGPEETVLAVELHLDTLGLVGASGALAFSAPESALSLFEHDLLNNMPLATCIVPSGGRAGETAVEAELKLVGGGSQRIVVQHGQIGRLPIPIGSNGTLTLHPSSGVRIGRNPAGTEVESDPGKIRGSALGVIIDARGRPLRLPETPIERQQLLWDWLTALGVESGPLPYTAAEPFSEALVPLATPSPNGDTAFAGPPAVAQAGQQPLSLPTATPPTLPTPADSIAELDSLAKLRQSVEVPKKRGIFRRK